MQFVVCTQLFNEKHVQFTTPDDVMTLILFKFLYFSFYDKKKKKKRNTVNVLKISTNAVAAQEHVVEVVPEHLYMSRLMTKTTK